MSTEPKDLFSSMESGSPQATQKLEPVLVLEIPGRLPSWNDVLGMEQWARYKFKNELADAFLCALRASAIDSSTKTISAKSTYATYAATLELYLRTRQAKRKLKLLKKKLEAKSESLSESKCSKSKIPF